MRIAVIGNIAGGKTRLCRHLAELHKIPLVHVDSVQFVPPMEIRPLNETRQILTEVVNRESWIIDGFGPLDLLEPRFQRADKIVLIDLSLTRHSLWLLKRQFTNLWQARQELPEGCTENSLTHIFLTYRRLWTMHSKMRPELLKMLAKDTYQKKVIHIRNRTQWNEVYRTSTLTGELR